MTGLLQQSGIFLDSNFWAFLVAITLLTMSPGVDTIVIIRNTLRGGARDGAVTSIAICLGLFVHAVISASSALSRTPESSLAGAVKETVNREEVSVWRSFREGFLSNVLNPKTVVFYMAFLPQFIQAGEPAMLKSLFLAAVHFCIANLWQILIVFMVGKASTWLLKGTVMKGVDGLIGTVMVGFGLKLALDRS